MKKPSNSNQRTDVCIDAVVTVAVECWVGVAVRHSVACMSPCPVDLCMLAARLESACHLQGPLVNGYCTLPRRPAVARRPVTSISSQRWLSLTTRGRFVPDARTPLRHFFYLPALFLWSPKARPLYFTADFLNFISIDERPAIGSQPNLASRSEVVSIYKCP